MLCGFKSQGFPLPLNFNPADHFINTLAVVPSNKETSLVTINKICDSFQESQHKTNLTNELKVADSCLTNPMHQIYFTNKRR